MSSPTNFVSSAAQYQIMQELKHQLNQQINNFNDILVINEKLKCLVGYNIYPHEKTEKTFEMMRTEIIKYKKIFNDTEYAANLEKLQALERRVAALSNNAIKNNAQQTTSSSNSSGCV